MLDIEPDELHAMHLGTSQYMAGSILLLLYYELLTSGGESSMEHVWAIVVEHYRNYSTPTQDGNLALSSFVTASQYPKLQGKEAEVKDLMLALWTYGRSTWILVQTDTISSKTRSRHNAELNGCCRTTAIRFSFLLKLPRYLLPR